MNKVWIGLVCLLLVTCSGGEYRTPHNRLGLTFPDGWTLLPNPSDGMLLQATSASRAVVHLAESPSGFLDSRSLRFFLYVTFAQAEDARLLSVKRTDRKGMKCLEVTYVTTFQGKRLQYALCQFGKGWDYFTLSLAAEPSRFAEMKAVFDGIVDSARFQTDEPGAATEYSADLGPLELMRNDDLQELNQQLLTALDEDPVDMARVASLLEEGADPNGFDSRQLTPLVMAASKPNRPLMRWLLEHGAEANHPLHQALFLMRVKPPERLFWEQKLAQEKALLPKRSIPVRKILKPPPTGTETAGELASELFSAIEYPKPNEVAALIAQDAPLDALHEDYGLTPLALTRKFIGHMDELGGDASQWREIEKMLAAEE
jgi:hypothetical protein